MKHPTTNLELFFLCEAFRVLPSGGLTNEAHWLDQWTMFRQHVCDLLYTVSVLREYHHSCCSWNQRKSKISAFNNERISRTLLSGFYDKFRPFGEFCTRKNKKAGTKTVCECQNWGKLLNFKEIWHRKATCKQLQLNRETKQHGRSSIVSRFQSFSASDSPMATKLQDLLVYVIVAIIIHDYLCLIVFKQFCLSNNVWTKTSCRRQIAYSSCRVQDNRKQVVFNSIIIFRGEKTVNQPSACVVKCWRTISCSRSILGWPMMNGLAETWLAVILKTTVETSGLWHLIDHFRTNLDSMKWEFYVRIEDTNQEIMMSIHVIRNL